MRMSTKERTEKYAGVYRGIYCEIAEDMGVEVAEKMFKNYGGLQLNFPKKLYTSEYYSQKILQEYEQGVSIQMIAKKYEYTERRIRQLLGQ